MPTVIAPANKGYVWNILGSPWGQASGPSVPSGGNSNPNYYLPHYDFNWPTLPAGAYITSAQFFVTWSGGLPMYKTDNSQLLSTSVWEIAESWTEGGTKPGGGGGILGSLSTNVSAGTKVSIDITSYVRSRYGGATKYGVQWGSEAYRDGSIYHYGYNQTDKPYIEITYITNRSPNEPTITVPSVFDAAAGLTINIRHNDPDNDNMSGVYLKTVDDLGNTRYRSAAGAWQATEPTSPIPASGTNVNLAISDAWVAGRTYQLYAATVDAQGVKGPYSSVAAQARASSKPIASAVTPTPGGTVATTRTRVVASMTCASGATPQSYTVTQYTASGTTVLSGPHSVNSSGLLDYEVPYDQLTATAYQVGVTPVDSDGLQGAEVKVAFTTAFTPPADPDNLTATPMPGRASIRLTWQAGSSPTGVESGKYHLSRKKTGADDSTYRVLSSQLQATVYEDFTAASGQLYEYRVLAVGTNGVLSDGSILTLTGAETEG